LSNRYAGTLPFVHQAAYDKSSDGVASASGEVASSIVRNLCISDRQKVTHVITERQDSPTSS